MADDRKRGIFADALGYPIRDGAWVMILLGAVLSLILDFLQIAPLFGLAVAIFGAGYFSGFYLDIISSTMTGGDRVPDWPEFSAFVDDILMPFLRIVGLVLVSFAPLIAVGIFVDEEARFFWGALIAAAVWGALYFPMATLGSLIVGNLFGALPHIVLPAVFRAMPVYLLAVVVLVAAFVVSGLAEELSGRIPFVGWLAGAAAAVYSLMAQARLIGLVYRAKREEIGWE